MDTKLYDCLVAIAIGLLRNDPSVKEHFNKFHAEKRIIRDNVVRVRIMYGVQSYCGCSVYAIGKGLGEQLANVKKGKYKIHYE